MRYRYQCTSESCQAITEITRPICTPDPYLPCQFCKRQANHVLEAPSVSRSNMGNQSFDVAVGKDSERRWGEIHAQQASRDKARKESGVAGLQGTSFGQYQPLTGEAKATRDRATLARAAEESRA
jgi:hypothetical protein